MKKIFILLLLPLFMSTQCDEDEDFTEAFVTDYKIQNNSSVSLIFLTNNNEQIVIDSETDYFFSSQTRTTFAVIAPSESDTFNTIELYTLDADNNLVLAYQQEPINDDLWEFTDTEGLLLYTLVITDDLLD